MKYHKYSHMAAEEEVAENEALNVAPRVRQFQSDIDLLYPTSIVL